MNIILISTGGSGGHVIPALNLFYHLQKDFDVYLYTDKRGAKYFPKEVKKTVFDVKQIPEKKYLLPLKIIFLFSSFIKSLIYLREKKFDIVYCKALEHIPNWKNVFKQISKVTKKNSIVYFKHRSFFSYLGPHRYATSGIPWGHLFFNDK